MGHVGKVEDGNAVQGERAAVDLSVTAHVDNHPARVELPAGMRQLAGGDGAVVEQVVVGAGLVDNLASEGEGSGGSQDHPIVAIAQPGGAGHVVEASRFE